MSALDVQVGGDHYKKYKIQPMEYSMANGLDACQHTAIKYITRFRDKGGIADLEKAKHCIDLLIEFERKAGQIETTDLSSKERTFVPGEGVLVKATGVNNAGLPEGWRDLKDPRPPFAIGTMLELMAPNGSVIGPISYTPSYSFEGFAAWRFGVPKAPSSTHQPGCTEKCAASICPCNDCLTRGPAYDGHD